MDATKCDKAPALSVGKTIARIGPRYLRLTDLETLTEDPKKAKKKLEWMS